MKQSSDIFTGAAELIVLQAVADLKEGYGYQLAQHIKRHSGDIFDMQEGTLYPVLYKLEDRKYVSSVRKQAESGKERRYYSLTKAGEEMVRQKKKEFTVFAKGMQTMLGVKI